MTEATVMRFDGVTRAAHWATAALGGVVLLTGTILYVPELSASIGRRAFLMHVHLYAGLVLPIPLILGVVGGRAGRRLRADLAELSRWRPADRRWLRRATRGVADGKFNGGQKLLTALVSGLFLVQLMTGSVMFWHNPFSDSWRTGATFVHDWAYLALCVVIVGHVVRAVQEPEMMHSMVAGDVPEAWARRERPTWL